MDDREVACRLDVRRLRTRRIHDREQNLVPVDHRLTGLLAAEAVAHVSIRVHRVRLLRRLGVGAADEDDGSADGGERDAECG